MKEGKTEAAHPRGRGRRKQQHQHVVLRNNSRDYYQQPQRCHKHKQNTVSHNKLATTTTTTHGGRESEERHSFRVTSLAHMSYGSAKEMAKGYRERAV